MKKFDEMSEVEILEYADSGINDYLHRIRPLHSEFVLEDCVERQVGAIRELFRRSRPHGGWASQLSGHLSDRDRQELDVTINHFLPMLRERAGEAQLRYMQGHTVWMIKGTAAKTSIETAFWEVGINSFVECQKHRAKAYIYVDGYTLIFYVRYKALEQEGVLDGLVKAVLDLKDAVGRIGGYIKLVKS